MKKDKFWTKVGISIAITPLVWLGGLLVMEHIDIISTLMSQYALPALRIGLFCFVYLFIYKMLSI